MSTYAIVGARNMRMCAYDGGRGGPIFVILVRTY